MSTLRELAEFSNAVYGSSTSDPTGEGAWQFLTQSGPNSDGYFAEARQNTQTHEIVIANRGTAPYRLTDLWNDAQLAYGVPLCVS